MATIGAFASIFDSAGGILLMRHAYGSRHWSTPGGRVEPASLRWRRSSAKLPRRPHARWRSRISSAFTRSHTVMTLCFLLRSPSFSGLPQPCLPEISDLAFFSREHFPPDLAFNTRVRIEDSFERCRGVVRVFDSEASLSSACATHVRSTAKA